MDVLTHWGPIHVDVCPDCGTPTTWHGMDPPGHCPHGYDRRVPVEYVPASQLRGAVEALVECVDAMRCFEMPLTPAEDGARAVLAKLGVEPTTAGGAVG